MGRKAGINFAVLPHELRSLKLNDIARQEGFAFGQLPPPMVDSRPLGAGAFQGFCRGVRAFPVANSLTKPLPNEFENFAIQIGNISGQRESLGVEGHIQPFCHARLVTEIDRQIGS